MNPNAEEARLPRAERRRIMRGERHNEPGMIACKFCKSTRGTFYKSGNRFVCQTTDCKGAKRP